MATILIVDDRAANRRLVSTVLGYRGHQVIEAADAAEALDRVQFSPPDLVITDILMPGMDGGELVRELRADPRTEQLPVLFYTANFLHEEVRPLADAYGVATILNKGDDPQVLMDAVDQVLAGRGPQPPGEPDPALVREHLRTVNAKLVRTIDEMETTERQLGRSEERFRQLAESAPVGLALCDPNGEAWYVNARLIQVMGAPAARLLGAGWRRYVDIADWPVAAARQPAEPHRRRVRLDRDDGTTGWLDLIISIIRDERGNSWASVVAVEDVTAAVEAEARQHHLDERLRVSERLESLGRLAGGIAHDFNNLLSAILGYAQFAQETTTEAIDEGSVDRDVGRTLQDHLTRVLAAGNRAAHLTAQLLTFGRPDIAQPEILDLNAVVADVVALLARTIGAHIDLATHPEEGLWAVRVDASQLTQVVFNLAINARDAMGDGGTLTISTGNQEVGAGFEIAPGRYARLTVTDTGAGIPPDVLNHIFEPFFTTKPPGEGTGLGLPTVHSIIRQAGGDITVHSAVGRGTTITVYLPAVQAVAADAQPEPDSDTGDAPGGVETVLVVDDEEGIRDITRRLLTAAGYRVLTAAGPAEALTELACRGGPIDLLLTDVVMPDMFGGQLAHRAVQIEPTIRVLYMSGYAEPLLRDGSLHATAAVLTKPFTRDALLRAVRATLDASPTASTEPRIDPHSSHAASGATPSTPAAPDVSAHRPPPR